MLEKSSEKTCTQAIITYLFLKYNLIYKFMKNIFYFSSIDLFTPMCYNNKHDFPKKCLCSTAGSAAHS